MNYSIETQERKTQRKALTYTFIIIFLLFGGILMGSAGSISKLTDTVKELVSGDQETVDENTSLEKRKRA